jgi:hypothetical protein
MLVSVKTGPEGSDEELLLGLAGEEKACAIQQVAQRR